MWLNSSVQFPAFPACCSGCTFFFFSTDSPQQSSIRGCMKYFFNHTLSTASNVSGIPLFLPLSDFFFFTFSRRTDGRKAAWHSFLMVQLSGRGASSWFMVPTLYCGAAGAWWLPPAPGSTLPHSGGQKWERVSNSERRQARESQGMTIDGRPSTTTTAADAAFTSLPHPTPEAALTWAASLSSPPPPSDSESPRPAKDEAPQASESSSSSRHKSQEKKIEQECVEYLPKAKEWSAGERCGRKRDAGGGRSRRRGRRRRRDGDVRGRRGEERRAEQSRAERCSAQEGGEESGASAERTNGAAA